MSSGLAGLGGSWRPALGREHTPAWKLLQRVFFSFIGTVRGDVEGAGVSS